MVLDPRSSSDIYGEIKTKLVDSIDSLTNFTDSGFNEAWVSAYSQQVHEIETRILAAELSGFVDHAGKSNYTEQELARLGVTDVDPNTLNELMADEQLDELAKIVGVKRNPGTKASGQVTFDVSTDSVEIEEGYVVGTEQDSDGSYLSYRVDADEDGVIDENSTETITPDDGASTLTADVIADEIGEDHNVGADTVTFIPNPKPGIEGVSNGSEINGGEDEQSNAEFREDVKGAVFSNSGGGTEQGIRGHIEENATGSVDVTLDQALDRSPPFVDVIVDGGGESEIEQLIEDSRPVGIRHNLVRPELMDLGVRAELVGTDIDSTYVKDQIIQHFTNLSLDDEFRRSRLIRDIHTADLDVEDIGALSVSIHSVTDESHIYQSGTTLYELNFAPLAKVDNERRLYDSGTSVYGLQFTDIDASSVTVTASVNGDLTDLTRGTDYEVIDADGDGNYDAIDFSIGGATPDNRTVIEVEYSHRTGSISSTITDTAGNSYSRGTDWDLVDNDGDGLNDSIDWSIDGSAPAGNERFFVDYSPKRDIVRDLVVSKRQKVSASDTFNVTTFDPVN